VGRPPVASVDGPINYRGQRNTFSNTKIGVFLGVFLMFFTSLELPEPVVFGSCFISCVNCQDYINKN
jgi:hypothetical protein